MSKIAKGSEDKMAPQPNAYLALIILQLKMASSILLCLFFFIITSLVLCCKGAMLSASLERGGFHSKFLYIPTHIFAFEVKATGREIVRNPSRKMI